MENKHSTGREVSHEERTHQDAAEQGTPHLEVWTEPRPSEEREQDDLRCAIGLLRVLSEESAKIPWIRWE